MKVTEFRREIRKADEAQLRETLAKMSKQLFTMRINAATSHVKDCSQFKKLRRSIARVLTELASRGEG